MTHGPRIEGGTTHKAWAAGAASLVTAVITYFLSTRGFGISEEISAMITMVLTPPASGFAAWAVYNYEKLMPTRSSRMHYSLAGLLVPLAMVLSLGACAGGTLAEPQTEEERKSREFIRAVLYMEAVATIRDFNNMGIDYEAPLVVQLGVQRACSLATTMTLVYGYEQLPQDLDAACKALNAALREQGVTAIEEEV